MSWCPWFSPSKEEALYFKVISVKSTYYFLEQASFCEGSSLFSYLYHRRTIGSLSYCYQKSYRSKLSYYHWLTSYDCLLPSGLLFRRLVRSFAEQSFRTFFREQHFSSFGPCFLASYRHCMPLLAVYQVSFWTLLSICSVFLLRHTR